MIRRQEGRKARISSRGLNVRRFHEVRIGVVAAAALILAGCGLGGSSEPETPTTDEAPTTDETSTDDTGGDDAPQDGEPEAGELQSGGGGRATPQDVNIDTSVRHPGGTVLSVTGVTFDGNEIRVAAELINGSSGDVRISLNGSDRLRLVDDLGGVYNFVVPADLRDRNIELSQGESIGGDFVFLGPVTSSAASLTLAANTFEDNPLPGDMESAFEGESTPTLVLDGIDLSW